MTPREDAIPPQPYCAHPRQRETRHVECPDCGLDFPLTLVAAPREDAIAAVRSNWPDDYTPAEAKAWIAACDRIEFALGAEAETPDPWADAMADPVFRASLDEGLADMRAGRVAALGAEAETPREDAIAALIEAARYVLDRLDTMVERQTLTGAEISRQQLRDALAALGAEAEPPDRPDPDDVMDDVSPRLTRR